MALGFQDCCNTSSYFYLNGIPATVSQNEFYHIITLEGPAFCATYTTIPALNYLPPTYTLDEMTEYTSCDTCFLGASLVCSSIETIFLSQFGPGSISLGTDCSIKTLFPMIVECESINPSFDGFSDGVVKLFVTGGTPPYSFFNATDGTTYGGALPVTNSIYTLIDGASEGTYPIRVVDAQSDFNITVNCLLSSPPTILTVTRTPVATTIAGACDGKIIIGISNGTPPYQIFINGVPTSLTTILNLCAGDYDITVVDSGVGLDQQINSGIVSVGEPGAITYPNNLCLLFTSLSLCNTTFYLTFTRQGSYNFRANYVCDNPEDLGLPQLILRWENGWTTTQETSNGTLNFTSPCNVSLPSLSIKFVKSSPTTEQPTGTWTSPLGMFLGQTANVSQGVCTPVGPGDPPVQPTLTFSTTNVQCGAVLGQVVLVGAGGAGAPYTYFLAGVAQTSATIPLPVGSYTATVTDSNNVSSNPVSFSIGQVPPVPISMDVTATVKSFTNDILTGSGGFGGAYGTNQLLSIGATIIGIPSGYNLQGYFKIKYKVQGIFTDTFVENLNSQIFSVALTFYGYKNSTIIPFSLASSSIISYFTSPRTSNINTNLLPTNQNNGCPTNPLVYYQRTLIREDIIGMNSPFTISNNDIFEFEYDITTGFIPQYVEGCQPAFGIEFDFQFIKTSADISCHPFVFNGGTTPFVASAKQVGDTSYLPNVYTNTVIING